MNLKRQLLLVSLLTLVLPWAGYQFIRETESALRAGQQQMLAGTARAIAESLARYPEEFPADAGTDFLFRDQLYGHRLDLRPEIDGYFDDWAIERASLVTLRGADGPVRFALGLIDEALEQRLLQARARFAELLQESDPDAVEFYDAERYNAAADLQPLTSV